jgi:hypothetical protein
MTNFRRLCFALALMVAFTVPALAAGGEINTPGASGDVLTPGASGDISTPGASGDISTPGALNPGEISTPGYSVHEMQSRAWAAFLWLIPELAL